MKRIFILVALLIADIAHSAPYSITQNQTAQPLVFFLTQSADHITGLTGATPTVTISKNGGSFASPSGAVTEIANGWYKVAGNATDANTLGPLLLHATAASADPTDEIYPVVAYNMQDTVRLGLTALPNVASGSAGAIITAGTGTAQLSTSSGAVTAGTVSDKTGYSLAGTQTFNNTGNITGNLSGSVGSVTSPVTANTTQLAGQTVTAAAGVTFPTSIASPTNITAGTITTVTNLTNAPTNGDLTNAMKTSVTTAATAATPTISSVSGSVGTCNALGATAKTDVTTAATASTPTCAGVSTIINANIQKINGVTVNGNGTTGSPWGP